MATQYITKKSSSYSHLSHEEREFIMIRKHDNISCRQIAFELGRSPSTIQREITRNKDLRSSEYRALLAQRKSQSRRKEASKRVRIPNPKTREYIESKLIDGWSPEQIAGRLKLENNGFITTHETIYQWIYNDRKDLRVFLVRAGIKRKKRGSAALKHTPRIKNKTPIEERPEAVNERKEIGHWEADTMVSRASKTALCVINERKHRLTIIEKITRKTAEIMKDAVTRRLGQLPSENVKTITFDNGTENAYHKAIDDELGCQSYFCNAYHSWEKGSVENAIGLIRHYIPKKTDINKIDEEEISLIEYALNNRPRKCLGYLTPMESYIAECCT